MNGKIEVLKKEVETIKKEKNGNFRTEKYSNGINKKHIQLTCIMDMTEERINLKTEQLKFSKLKLFQTGKLTYTSVESQKERREKSMQKIYFKKQWLKISKIW